jgi:hypothetical protein
MLLQRRRTGIAWLMELIALIAGDHLHLTCARDADLHELDEVLTETQVDDRCGDGVA